MKTNLTLRRRFAIVVAIGLGFTLVILSLATLVAAWSAPTVNGVVDDVYYTDGQAIYFANATWPDYMNTLYVLDDGSQDIYFAYVVSPDFVDNTYGANTIGWPSDNHKFKHLWGSDMQRFEITDGCGAVVLDFQIDLLAENQSTPSTYGTSGVIGGGGDQKNGWMYVGSALSLTVDTSLDYNLNDTVYCSAGSCDSSTTGLDLLVDSPPTDADYTPNPEYPLWQYEIIYEVRVDRAVFGDCGLGFIDPTSIHASPSKVGPEIIPVDKLGSIGDYVWNDVDRDGIQDSAEAGINGVVVELYKGGVLQDSTTTTNAPGTSKPGWYLFTDLDAGDYIVKIADSNFVSGAVLEPHSPTIPNAGDDAVDSDGDPITHEAAVTLTSGEQNLTIDFGFADCAIGDRVWHDQDGNGNQTGASDQEGWNNVEVYLYRDVDGDGVFEPNGDDGASLNNTITISGTSQMPDGYLNGIYGFDMSVLGAGQYWVWVDESTLPPAPGGYYWASTTGGDHQWVDYTIDIFSVDFGYKAVALGSIGDYVWFDYSNPGIQDSGEVGFNDVELELWLDNDGDGNVSTGDTRTMTMTTQTHLGNDGWYLFDGLFAGDYIVKIAEAEFDSGGTLYVYAPTAPNQVDDALDSDGDNPTCPYSPTIGSHTCPGGDSQYEDNILATTTLTADAAGNVNQDLTVDFGVVYTGPPTVITLSSFAARSSAGGSASRLWLGLVGLTVLAAGSLFWTKRRAS